MIIFLCLSSGNFVAWLSAIDIIHFCKDLYSKPLSHSDSYCSCLCSGGFHKCTNAVHLLGLQTSPVTTTGAPLLLSWGFCSLACLSTDIRRTATQLTWEASFLTPGMLLECAGCIDGEQKLSPVTSIKYTPGNNLKYLMDHLLSKCWL